MTKIRIMTAIFLYLGMSFQVNASLLWEWEFVESDLYVEVGDIINIEVLVRNSADSDTNLAISMLVLDGSWGELVRGPDYVATINLSGFGLFLEPGSSVQFQAAHLTPYPSADNFGDTLIVNPIMYGFEHQFPALYPPPTDGTGKNASDPLAVRFSAVPVPPSLILFISGIFALIRLGKSA